MRRFARPILILIAASYFFLAIMQVSGVPQILSPMRGFIGSLPPLLPGTETRHAMAEVHLPMPVPSGK